MKSVILLMVNVNAKKVLVVHVVTSVWTVGLTFQIAKHVNVQLKDQAQKFVTSRMDNVIATPTLEDVNAHNVPLDSIGDPNDFFIFLPAGRVKSLRDS